MANDKTIELILFSVIISLCELGLIFKIFGI